jgi:hypothetical protein
VSQRTRVVWRVAAGLLALCATGLLVTYAVLRPVRATGPAARGTATPDTESAGAKLGPAEESPERSRPTLILDPSAGSPGQTIQVTGGGFAPGVSVALRLGVPNAGLSKANLITAIADAHGAFEAQLTMPTEWPGTQNPIIEHELVIAAVDEAQSQTLAIAPFTNQDAYKAIPSRTPDPGKEPPSIQILPYSLAWAPSGRWLAYTSADGRAWLHARDSELSRSINGIQTSAPADLKAVWSPDGTRLLIYGEWGYPRSTGLWWVPVSDQGAGEMRPIVAPVEVRSPVEQNSGAIGAAAWSPDSGRIAYTFQAEAWTYDLGRSQSQRVTNLAEQSLSRAGSTEPFDGVREIAWSADGRLLALGLSCNCPSPWSGVGIVDLDSQETRLLVDGGHSVSWSPDGRWIAFQNASGDWTGGSTFDFYGIDAESGEITNLTRSNPGWDPLRPAEGTYRDADYQTAGLRWGTGGGFLYETLDYSVEGGVAPVRGFVVQSNPVTVLEARFGDERAWYVFPTWLADGRYAYLEATSRDNDPQTYAIRRAVVGQQVLPMERAYVRGAAWAGDGSAVALCVTNGPGSASSEVLILTLSLPVLP